MPDGFTLLWSKERWKQVQTQAPAGEYLNLLFGGPHQSGPGFRKYGVRPGDSIYPVTVSAGVLYLLGRMKVERLLSIDEYVAENAETFASYHSDWGAGLTFHNWQKANPNDSYLAPMCTDEAALGSEGTPLGIKVAVPADILTGLRFRSRQSERPIKYVVDGRLKSAISLQGATYRLTEESAQQLEAVLQVSLHPGT